MPPAPSTAPTLTIVFDAHCLLCSAWVRFLLRRDRMARLRFAAMQGITGQALLAQAGLQLATLDTLLLHDGTRHWCHSAALIRILDALGWPWRAAWLAWLIPAPLRDGLYRVLARNRYRLFGRSAQCLLPPAEHASRFLD